MLDLSVFSNIVLYILLALLGFFTLLLFGWQVNVLKGKAMDNPDGSTDDWHEQKILYGMAFADIVIIVPTTFISIILIILNSYWGFLMLGFICFWHIWVNSVTTITSLRFQKPKISISWFFVFPFGIFLGLIYIIWFVINFNGLFIM